MNAAHDAYPIERLRTGSDELDQILGGGFPVNSINVILGEPGTGKTILAEHLIFANARGDERPIVYLTTLSEPLDKVVRYVQQFDFYDAADVAEGRVVYESVAQELASDGAGALATRLRELIKTLSPRIVVIDSFKAVHDLAETRTQMRRTMHEIAGLLTAFETTAFLVGEYSDEMIATHPEFAVADSMVQLTRQRHTDRDERYLRVLKLRGSSYQEGLHAYRIGDAGLEVFPRLRTPQSPLPYAASDVRVSSGVPGLDDMMHGGLWRGTTTLIKGDSGTGKTTLALQFVLDGLQHGEPALYVNFQENPTQLARAVARLGVEAADAHRSGLHFLYASPVELQIDTIVVEFFRMIQTHGIRRVAIDAIGDLFPADREPQRLVGYLYTLSQHFAERGITSVMTLETYRNDHPLSTRLSAMCDTILRLGIDRGATQRTIEIAKARGTGHDMAPRELVLGPAGGLVR